MSKSAKAHRESPIHQPMTQPTPETLTKQTLSGFKWSSLSTILQGVLQLTIFTTLAHLLGPREFGIVGMAAIFTNFIERVGCLGVGQALVQREKLTEAHIRCAFVLSLSFGLSLFAIFYFAAPFIASFFEERELVTVLRCVAFSFLFASAAEVSISLLQRQMKFKRLLVVTNFAYLIGNGVVGITLAYLGYGYWALVAAIVVARFIRMFSALLAVPQKLSLDFSRQEVKDLLKIGIGFSLGRMSNYWALVGDNFVAGKVLGAASLGLYSRAYQLMTAPATYFGQVLEKVLFAALSQRQSDKAKVARYYIYGIELCSLASISGATLLTLAAPEIISVFFGRQWLGAVDTVQILAFGVYFRTCYKNSDTVIRALGAVYRLASQQMLYAVLVIGGSIVGSKWGIEGIAWAVLFAVFSNYMMLSIFCMRQLSLSLKDFIRAHLSTIWVACWQFLVLSLTMNYLRTLPLGSAANLLFACLIDGLITLLAIASCPRGIVPTVFPWLSRNLNLSRFGLPGRVVLRVLDR